MAKYLRHKETMLHFQYLLLKQLGSNPFLLIRRLLLNRRPMLIKLLQLQISNEISRVAQNSIVTVYEVKVPFTSSLSVFAKVLAQNLNDIRN